MSNTQGHAISWFEIPATDIDRAIMFYQQVLNLDIKKQEFGDTKMGVIPGINNDQNTIRGAIVQDKSIEPSTKGTLIYLAGGDDLNVPLARVVEAGGTVLQEKAAKGHHGFFAVIKDPEGNRVALHSMK